ncbi:hypothetical protein [Mesorhizobium sp. L48C026A00]|uniref:hypothetical protein n=1 Tax=Mesorhizobium sp. L48C026A00 TaxID=1287182 RepID=UPI0003D032A4|nr:hypothetical protein [Mesorhizobium sp. L48C026A00]ESZ22325.1 hypothetical protein X737_02675 [Mesorhizobium sp. L48C026A00]
MVRAAPACRAARRSGVWRTSACPPEIQKAANAALRPAIQKIGPPRDARSRSIAATGLRSMSMPLIDGVVITRKSGGETPVLAVKRGSTS